MSWHVIATYSRAQALADGVLIPVPEHLAREAGLTVPVACTAAVWDDCVAWTPDDTTRTGAPQDETGRLWDLLTMTRHAATRSRNQDRVTVELLRVPRQARSPEPEHTSLTAVIGPGDQGEPVLTLLHPGDD